MSSRLNALLGRLHRDAQHRKLLDERVLEGVLGDAPGHVEDQVAVDAHAGGRA